MNGICLNWQRVGTHPLLPLPLGSEHDDACSLVVRNHRAPINKIVEQKLHAYEIPANNDEDTSLVHYDNPREPEYLDYCGWSVMSRSTCEAPYTSYVTVLVVAPWDRTTADTWCKAAFDIKHHLDCELLWPYGVDIKVEIIAPELLGRNHFAPVTGRDDLDRDWELIRATIRRKIERYEQVRMAWNCIALFSHGIYKNTTRNPPTVYITIASTCDEYEWNWDLRKDLQEYLDQSGYGLNLCMEHCAVDSFGTMAVKEPEGPSSEILEFSPFATMNPYGKTVSMGAELSASTDIIMTHHEPIEARIELDEQDIMANIQGGDGQWKTYALTNYHTVRPAIPGFRCNARGDLLPSEPESELRRIDKEGLRREERMNIAIESPSQALHQERIKSLRVMRDTEPEQKKWERAIEEQCKFMEQGKHIFGYLYAASGCGFGKDGAFLDWALIDVVPGRIGENRLPDKETWPQRQEIYSPSFGLEGLRQPADLCSELEGCKLEPVCEDDASPSFWKTMWERRKAQGAYQRGATAQSTTGNVSRHKAAVRWGPDDVEGTTEAVFVRKRVPEWVVRPDSDSGSVLYDWKGRALGMLLGTRQPRLEEGAFFFVTPMEDILGHIAFMLEVERTAVRIAEL